LYEYNSLGSQVDFFADTATRGVFELLNGNYLYTNGTGTFVLNPVTGLSSALIGDGDRFIGSFTAIPEPASGVLFALGAVGCLLARRRR
jgi:hypothetical protein